MKKEVLEFLKREKCVAIATTDENGKPWIANLYFGVDKDLNMYVVSKRTTKHSIHIEANPEVAYTVAWYNREDDEERVAIQATGKAKLVTSLKDMGVGAICIFEKFADWKIDPKDMLTKIKDAGMYKITPTYMKFWNDKLLGHNTKDIDLNS